MCERRAAPFRPQKLEPASAAADYKGVNGLAKQCGSKTSVSAACPCAYVCRTHRPALGTVFVSNLYSPNVIFHLQNNIYKTRHEPFRYTYRSRPNMDRSYVRVIHVLEFTPCAFFIIHALRLTLVGEFEVGWQFVFFTFLCMLYCSSASF